MPKLPYLPLYTGDWLKDPALTLCTPATRGVWIDLLAVMHELDRSGELRGTAEQLARTARCSTVEFAQAVTELQTNRAAEVVFRNDVYVVSNRRMQRDFRRRKQKEESSTNIKDKKQTAKAEYEIEIEFERFWKNYPSGRKQSKAAAREAFAKAIRKVDPETIIEAAKEYANSEVGRGRYVKMPSAWLNQECWADDRAAWREKDRPPGEKAASLEVEQGEFDRYFREGKFDGKPQRHATIPTWWYGTLKDGTKVHCKNIQKRTP